MVRAYLPIIGLMTGMWITPAWGQWADFADDTANRLVAAPEVGVDNPDEKDYAWDDLDNDGDIDLVAVYKLIGTSNCSVDDACRRNALFMNEGMAEGHPINGVLVDRTLEFISNENGTIGVVGSSGFLDLTNDRDVAIADVNGDGWKDIITSTTLSGNLGKMISHPRIYINRGLDGGGLWLGFIFDDVDRVPTMPAEPRFCAVSTGDIDGDNDIDLYFGDYQQGGSRPVDLNDRLWINDGTGFFTDETAARMTFQMVNSSFGMATAIADMNGDGRDDIVKDTALTSPIHVAISYNNNAGAANQDGFFDDFNVVYLNSPYHITVGDLNNDGRMDIVITDDGEDRYILNQGNNASGVWQGFLFDDENRVPTMPAEPRFCAVSTGDVDGDGDVDLYFGDYQQGGPRPVDLNDRLWINDGTGYFTDQTSTRMTAVMVESSFGMATAIADMNGDGKLDVIKDDALNAPQGVSISYNDGTSQGFFASYEVPHNFAPYHVTVGDLNNDNKMDMVVTDDNADRYRLNIGNGSDGLANFQASLTFTFTGGGFDDGFGGNSVIEDLNNDGWNDVIITDVDVDIPGCSRRTHIYRNL
ncbi:MAG: FG-GAP repeat domain-containing protein, partial [Phycisphaerae bacterium]